jgi:hypothetical protein
MNIIYQNPYRVIGLFAGAKLKDIERQRSKINAYLNVGREFSFDLDFSFFNPILRNEKVVNNAFTKIELNQDKLLNGLFWFINYNHIDEPAFNYLKDGNFEKATEIWSKIVNNNEISVRNFSSFQNLSTLKIALAFSNDSVDKNILREGILLKTRLIESNIFNEFIATVADETFKINIFEFTKYFLDEILNESILDYNDIKAIFSDSNSQTQEYVSAKFINDPIHNIESKIEKCKNRRFNKTENEYELGKILFNESIEELEKLQKYIEQDNTKYHLIADKLAREILQCGIEHFNRYRDNNQFGTIGEESLELIKISESIAKGNLIRQRIEENKKGVEDAVKYKTVDEHFKFILNEIESIRNSDFLENVKSFLINCKPRLEKVKRELGEDDTEYLNLSTSVVGISNEIAIGILNGMIHNVNRRYYQSNLKETLLEVWTIMLMINYFDMHSEFRNVYSRNYWDIKNLIERLYPFGVFINVEKYFKGEEPAVGNKIQNSFIKNNAWLISGIVSASLIYAISKSIIWSLLIGIFISLILKFKN